MRYLASKISKNSGGNTPGPPQRDGATPCRTHRQHGYTLCAGAQAPPLLGPRSRKPSPKIKIYHYTHGHRPGVRVCERVEAPVPAAASLRYTYRLHRTRAYSYIQHGRCERVGLSVCRRTVTCASSLCVHTRTRAPCRLAVDTYDSTPVSGCHPSPAPVVARPADRPHCWWPRLPS